jgi:hypothetical protein
LFSSFFAKSINDLSTDTLIALDAIMGKVSKEALKNGEAWVSKEGIKKLMEYMNQW